MSSIGISCYITSLAGLQAVIARCIHLGLNTIRIASRQSWLDPLGASNRAFHKEYIDYILANTNFKVIIDPNHVWYATDANGNYDPDGTFNVAAGSQWIRDHWSSVETGNENNVLDWVLAIAAMYPNNDRVIIEVFNEYSLSDFWDLCQTALDYIRQFSANFILFNKWDQSWGGSATAPTPLRNDVKTLYSYHYYFGGYTNPWTAQRALDNVDLAIARGLKVINTEIGPDSRGGTATTATEVAVLNTFLQGCADRHVGNCIWNTNNDQDFNIMESLGLDIPVVPPEPVILTILGDPNAQLTPAPGIYENIPYGEERIIRCDPLPLYYFKDFIVNQVPTTQNPLILNMTESMTVQVEVTQIPPTPSTPILPTVLGIFAGIIPGVAMRDPMVLVAGAIAGASVGYAIALKESLSSQQVLSVARVLSYD